MTDRVSQSESRRYVAIGILPGNQMREPKDQENEIAGREQTRKQQRRN